MCGLFEHLEPAQPVPLVLGWVEALDGEPEQALCSRLGRVEAAQLDVARATAEAMSA